MKKILVVGFGRMGCRHVQSLLAAGGMYEIHIVEPSRETRRSNVERIGVETDLFRWYDHTDDAGGHFDLAILATSSAPRFGIITSLLEKGIKRFLVEKIVFQSAAQFDAVIHLLQEKSARAYCNFTSRYFDAYDKLRSFPGLRSGFTMTVHGGAFGLGCNAIHYADIFQYLSGSDDITLKGSSLDINDTENRRGSEYRELTGSLYLGNGRGDKLFIVSEKSYTGGVTVRIAAGNMQCVLSEETGKMHLASETGCTTGDFVILPTSKLTAVIAEDIFKDDCRLTTIPGTAKAHAALFRAFNTVFHKTHGDGLLCPVT